MRGKREQIVLQKNIIQYRSMWQTPYQLFYADCHIAGFRLFIRLVEL